MVIKFTHSLIIPSTNKTSSIIRKLKLWLIADSSRNLSPLIFIQSFDILFTERRILRTQIQILSLSLSNPYTQSNSNTNLLKYTSLLKSQAETPYTLCIKAIHSSIAADFPLSDPEPVPRLLQYYLYRRPRLTSICACKHQ